MTPITGTLAHTLTTYPFSGYTTSEVPNTGGIVVDATGDIFYGVIYMATGSIAGRAFIYKYVYSTSTVTNLGYISARTNFDFPLGLCWNSDRTKLIAFETTNPTGSGSEIFEITLTSFACASLGFYSTGPITGLRYDSTLGEFLLNFYVNKEIKRINLSTLVNSVLVTFPKFGMAYENDADYIYGLNASDVPGVGPLYRLHRAKSYFMEFLCGGGPGAAASLATNNPDYAAFPLKVSEMVKAGDNSTGLLYMAHREPDNSNRLIAYSFADRSVKNIMAIGTYDGPEKSRICTRDDGSMVALGQGTGGVKFYT